MISTNRFSRYSLYAIGEVVLVVIGILIALQINNWNENRQNRNYELTMLKQVRDALEADSKIVENLLPYIEQSMRNIHKMAEMKNDPSLPTDSLSIYLTSTLNFGANIAYNKSPYNAIESGGLDRISNDEIRKNLSELYGFSLTNSEIWINEVLRSMLFKKIELFSEVFGIEVVPRNNNLIGTRVLLKDPSIIYNNPDFDFILSTAGWTLPRTHYLLNSLNDKSKALIEQIDKELQE